MIPLRLTYPGERLSLLCLGAHSDDIEIGVGGTILQLMASGVQLEVHWCVLSANGVRAKEAKASATAFLDGIQSISIELETFRDGYFPYQGAEIKSWVEALRTRVDPDIIFTHSRDDAHQDHREVCKLTWNAFRNHLILEYEVPKWDGDLFRPNLYMPISCAALDRKTELLLKHFGTQRCKDWFDERTFRGLARLRGIECRAAEHYAEGFVMRKARLA